MKDSRRYMRVAAVLVIAGATGHVMQNGEAIAARLGMGEVAGAPARGHAGKPVTHVAVLSTPVSGPMLALDFVPGREEPALAWVAPEVLPAPPPVQLAALDAGAVVPPDSMPGRTVAAPSIQPAPPAAVPAKADAGDCTPTFIAVPAEAAMVNLSVHAPCLGDARVDFEHAGFRFAERLDQDGRIDIGVPALAVDAQFTASLDGVPLLTASAMVAALADYDRVAVAWTGPEAIGLHAFEFGADYGDAGHVWQGAAKSDGALLRLGDPTLGQPAYLEVYSLPIRQSGGAGSVRFTFEVEVTPDTCGRDLAAKAVQMVGGQVQPPLDVTLNMPACDGLGGFLVMNTLFDDFRVQSAGLLAPRRGL